MTDSSVSEEYANTSNENIEEGDGVRGKAEVVEATRKRKKNSKQKMLAKKRKVDNSQVRGDRGCVQSSKCLCMYFLCV